MLLHNRILVALAANYFNIQEFVSTDYKFLPYNGIYLRGEVFKRRFCCMKTIINLENKIVYACKFCRRYLVYTKIFRRHDKIVLNYVVLEIP